MRTRVTGQNFLNSEKLTCKSTTVKVIELVVKLFIVCILRERILAGSDFCGFGAFFKNRPNFVPIKIVDFSHPPN